MWRTAGTLAIAVVLGTTACGTRVAREAAVQAQPGSSVSAPVNQGQEPQTAGMSSGSTVVNTGAPAPAGTSTAARPGTGISPASGGAASVPGSAAPRSTGGPAAGSNPATGGNAGGAAAPSTPARPVPGVPATPGGTGPKAPITIGEVGVLSGPIGTNMKPIADGVRVWVRWINDQGGVNGHPVVLVQGDSGGDPARHRSLVQQFVEQKNVVAFVGQPGDVFSGAGSVEYLTKAGVPVIGSEGGANWYYESPVYFPHIVHGKVLVQSLGVGTAREMVARKQSKLAIWTCVEAQTCTDADNIVPKAATRNGVKVVHSAKISIGQPDFTAECLSARNAGAEAVLLAADGTTISRGAASCARQGYRPTWVIMGAEILAKQHADDPNVDGAIVLDSTFPWFLQDTPRRKEFADAAARYAGGTSPTSPMATGWTAAKVFEFAVAQAAEPIGRATLLQALGTIHGDPFPDLMAHLLYSSGKPALPSMCYYLETLRGGKWSSPDNGTRHCADYDPTLS